jgi:hypothetical protein
LLVNRNQNRAIRSSMGDCHSFDPGSKFGLERKTNKKKQQPNEHPGPGAAYTFFSISNSNPAKVEIAVLLPDDTATLVLLLKDEKWGSTTIIARVPAWSNYAVVKFICILFSFVPFSFISSIIITIVIIIFRLSVLLVRCVFCGFS